MELVDIYRARRPIGHTHLRDGWLQPTINPRSSQRASVNPDECAHERSTRGFAHRRSKDEHWPVAFCEDCLTVLAGLDPFNRARRPRWKYHERNVVAAKWAREWPKPGRPRLKHPPDTIVWPDAA